MKLSQYIEELQKLDPDLVVFDHIYEGECREFAGPVEVQRLAHVPGRLLPYDFLEDYENGEGYVVVTGIVI
jgi:hypothetical protein